MKWLGHRRQLGGAQGVRRRAQKSRREPRRLKLTVASRLLTNGRKPRLTRHRRKPLSKRQEIRKPSLETNKTSPLQTNPREPRLGKRQGKANLLTTRRLRRTMNRETNWLCLFQRRPPLARLRGHLGRGKPITRSREARQLQLLRSSDDRYISAGDVECWADVMFMA